MLLLKFSSQMKVNFNFFVRVIKYSLRTGFSRLLNDYFLEYCDIYSNIDESINLKVALGWLIRLTD